MNKVKATRIAQHTESALAYMDWDKEMEILFVCKNERHGGTVRMLHAADVVS